MRFVLSFRASLYYQSSRTKREERVEQERRGQLQMARNATD
jgi:hypothetical protein